MSVSGICQVCESAQASHACDQCGQIVCAEHYDEGRGLCVQCARLGGGRQL